MRTKLSPQVQPTPEELYFIELMNRTSDHFGYRESWLVLHINRIFNLRITGRTLREWKERYNTLKYLDIPTVTYRIYTLKGLYRKVDIHSKYKEKIRVKQLSDLKCALIDYHSYLKVLDDGSGLDQIDMLHELLKEEV